MHTNRLVNEKSPYLLQHAHNPVDWYAWGEEAFRKAREENKPIFLSIGYSTCHWCHVMERESFENEEIAAILNRDFVSIKVDREERPDIDRIYMTYVQASTGSGGWPMSVWLTPQLKPFVGGTYFPPESRYGRPGFPQILERIAHAWRTEHDRIVESAGEVIEQLRKQTEVTAAREGSVLGIHPDVLNTGFQVFRRSFDSRLGGFGGAPKFPRPVSLHYLLRYHARTKNQEALDMTVATLRAMALGGMNDQIGGGFHRYSVDERWFVPHFEKMLYDQAQLAISYLEAYQITKDEFLAQTARDIFEYVLRDLRDAKGGFYSAEDADSVIDPKNPKEKGEGAFYIWTEDEIVRIVKQPAAEWFCYRYGVESDGNVDNDPHHEFTGRNILFASRTVEATALHFGQPVEKVRAALAEAAHKLMAARSARVRPHLDDKVLTAWNGLMISAFAKGGAILNEPRYTAAARQAADFLASQLYDARTGTLLRRYRAGDAAIPGFLDDYAFFAQALLDLYETGFETRDLDLAVKLTERQQALFEDRSAGAFYSTAAADEHLVLRMKEDYDGAEPGGNSVAIQNLHRLAQMTGREEFSKSAAAALKALAPRVMASPVSVPFLLAAYGYSLAKPKQVVLAGPRGREDTLALLRVLHSTFLPDAVVLSIDSPESRAKLAAAQPALATMTEIGGKTAAYVCENFTCKLPVSDPVKFRELLQ